jgi:hypothetical protein
VDRGRRGDPRATDFRCGAPNATLLIDHVAIRPVLSALR